MFSTSTNHPVTPVNLPPQIVSISSISIHLRKTWHLRVVTLLQMLDAASEGTLSVAKVLWGIVDGTGYHWDFSIEKLEEFMTLWLGKNLPFLFLWKAVFQCFPTKTTSLPFTQEVGWMQMVERLFIDGSSCVEVRPKRIHEIVIRGCSKIITSRWFLDILRCTRLKNLKIEFLEDHLLGPSNPDGLQKVSTLHTNFHLQLLIFDQSPNLNSTTLWPVVREDDLCFL